MMRKFEKCATCGEKLGAAYYTHKPAENGEHAKPASADDAYCSPACSGQLIGIRMESNGKKTVWAALSFYDMDGGQLELLGAYCTEEEAAAAMAADYRGMLESCGGDDDGEDEDGCLGPVIEESWIEAGNAKIATDEWTAWWRVCRMHI